ncbi:hypothetical protein BuS5_04042 (plasmid) [Desulfosarcina sp. BuS5]|uniref:S26 family signal peptidase n=1 Tax=Desulfosarcina sp. BuS5 TaxID=933262 RepID=UPI0023784DA4|nr:S26 family signal peptidase [Desulfosarcina sp. BuS5]WDN91070.1 hypothetical protein BuS5_04042 [Desulfosarcina sp. BuS5]
MEILKRFRCLINGFGADFLNRTKQLKTNHLFCFVIGIASITYAGASIPAKLSISPTNSVGYHLFFYKKNFRKSDLKKDTMVVVPLYTRLIDNCWPCLAVKYIKCDANDKLLAETGSFFCNNIYLGAAKSHSQKGVLVKAFTYDGTIPENYFFDMGTNIDSYDSRYTGLVSKDDVKAVAIPLF